MRRVNSFLGYLYRHHFVRYLFVGGTTFLIDFSLLILLHGKVGLGIATATSIAYWTSIAYNFSLNRWWTFSARERDSLHKHAAMYGLLLGFNYLFTVVFVTVASHFIFYGAAKILAVAISISWTYFIYKNVIFVNKAEKVSS